MLSKEDLNLAKEEVIALTRSDYEIHDNLLIASTDKKLEKRLGYTHYIMQWLFTAESLDEVRAFDWEKHYDQSFCVRGGDEKEIAKIIWKSLKKPNVDLENPGSRFEFFFVDKKIICGLFLAETDKSYLERKAHLRPALHPTSLHPRLARACINLSGVEQGTLLDPFCGSGGILIEAGFMGYEINGYDIDDEMLERCLVNLDYYGLKANLKKKDATKNIEKVDVIVTDLPYGKNSKVSQANLMKLYLEFLKSAGKICRNMVVIFPSSTPYGKIIEKTRWEKQKEFSIYIHKNLKKKITLLKNRA